MTYPSLVPDEPNKGNPIIPWYRIAPTSMTITVLYAVVCGSFLLIGSFWTQLQDKDSKELAKLEKAINDAPTQYQARLSERVAVVETETRRNTKALEANTEQTAKLTTQVALLTAAVNAGRMK